MISSNQDSEFRKKIAEARAFLENNKLIAKEELYDKRPHVTYYLFQSIFERALSKDN